MSGQLIPFVDDQDGIPDDTVLYRRVSWDRIGGRQSCPSGEQARLSGNCFRDYPEDKAREMGYPGPCMSVGAETIFRQLGVDPRVMISGYEGYGLAAVTAGDLRGLIRSSGAACPQGVMLRGTVEEPWHAVVFDLGGSGKRPAAVCDAISRQAYWVIPLVNEIE